MFMIITYVARVITIRRYITHCYKSRIKASARYRCRAREAIRKTNNIILTGHALTSGRGRVITANKQNPRIAMVLYRRLNVITLHNRCNNNNNIARLRREQRSRCECGGHASAVPRLKAKTINNIF